MLCVWVLSQPALTLANPDSAANITPAPHKSDIVWPLLPGESLQNLAKKLYPQSPILQQRFVQKTLSLSRHRGILLQATEKVDHGRLIIVPDGESLHTLTHPIKKADLQTTTPEVPQGLALSLELSATKTNANPNMLFLSQWMSHLPALPKLLDFNVSGWQSFKSWTIHTSEHSVALGQEGFNDAWQHIHAGLRAAAHNYTANAQLIARTPLHQMHTHPQQALITLSALLLLVLSVFWGMVERKTVPNDALHRPLRT